MSAGSIDEDPDPHRGRIALNPVVRKRSLPSYLSGPGVPLKSASTRSPVHYAFSWSTGDPRVGFQAFPAHRRRPVVVSSFIGGRNRFLHSGADWFAPFHFLIYGSIPTEEPDPLVWTGLMRAAIRGLNPAQLPPCCSWDRRIGTRAGLTPARNPCVSTRLRPAPGGRSGSSAHAPVRSF